jgi:subtilisin family serine protease
MRISLIISLGLHAAIAASLAMVQPVMADGFDLIVQAPGGGKGKPGGGGDSDEETGATGTLQTWMNGEIQGAWDAGYLGQSVTITVVEDFNSSWGYYGDLGNGTELLRHGEWTLMEASMIAPGATMVADEFTRGGSVKLADGFNVLNLSYGIYATTGYDVDQLLFGKQESSIISYAENGQAVISKAAGNDAVAVGTGNSDNLEDYLATALIGAQSAIFVGALDTNVGSLAWYSNFAGTDTTVQAQFLVVGVDGALTGLYGTSFAAPIISGYAAVLSSKFTSATPTQVASQLLMTARDDTITGYDVAIHGQGEASIFYALAQVSIN